LNHVPKILSEQGKLWPHKLTPGREFSVPRALQEIV
jgi:hypothetical protein